MPWRSVWLPRAVTAAALLIGVPLFLRSPPWCDLTLYQLAARNLLHGGVHYRDLFDTNLPGFVWVMTLIYAVFGASTVAVRAIDLAIVFSVVWLIDRLAKRGGATLAGRWWMFAGAAVFYPFTAEASHAQRDVWMALPGLAAVAVRVRAGTSPVRTFRSSFLEGMLWGCGVWIKPHMAVMALGVWLLTFRRLAGNHPRPWRAAALDLLGNIAGGLAIALPGIAWLFASGAWDSFRDVFQNWNPQYMRLSETEFDDRLDDELHWFPPWSLGLVVSVPLALASVLDMAPWRSRAGDQAARGWLRRWVPALLWEKKAASDERFVRGVLGWLYLIWAAQAFFLQRAFLYVHIPETLLMLGLWAAHRWAWTPLMLLWLAVSGIVWCVAEPQVLELDRTTREHYLPRHTATRIDRTRLWPVCWRTNLKDAERYDLWDRLRLMPPHEASIGWEELAEVAAFLREQGIPQGEVIAWHDSPHAVYLILDQKPPFRFMHVFTACIIGHDDPWPGTGKDQVMRELRQATGAKYVIGDLEWTPTVLKADDEQRALLLGPPRDPPRDLLPAHRPEALDFPFNQPTVFRTRNGTGRYVVHRIVTRRDSK